MVSLNLKKITKIIITIVIALGLWTCIFHQVQMNRVFGKVFSETINPKSQSFQEIIDASDVLTIEKKILSIRKHYYILSDGVLVGGVKGKLFPLFGDTLELRDTHGKLIKKEMQIKRLGLTQEKIINLSLSRLAKIEDAYNNTAGYIGEEKLKDFIKIKRIQYFYNKDYKKKGSATSDSLLFSKDYKIFDINNNVDYVIDGNFFSPTSKHTIDIIDSSDVSVEDSIFYTIIEDSIKSSKVKNSGSGFSKSKKKFSYGEL